MLKGIFQSFGELGRQILFGRRPQVIFYYPQLFNRAKDGTNPYFAPLKKICDKGGIRYIALEEPSGGVYPRDSRVVKADALLAINILMHRVMGRVFRQSGHKCDCLTGRIIDIITFGRLRAKTYITISNSMIDALGELNPRGRVYDMQHGIIYYGHPGYFLNADELRPEFLRSNRRVLLWGELYKRNLRTLPDGVDSDDKFIVAGYPLYRNIEIVPVSEKKRILVSLQFTSDIDSEKSARMLEMLSEFVAIAREHGYEILLKHHPRFANEVDMKPLIEQSGGQVKMTTDSLESLARNVRLQVTWGSTTTMEFAAFGIPTLFLRDERFDWATDHFYGQYSYPLYDGMTAEDVLRRIDSASDYESDRKSVKSWYESAYSPLNEELLLKILHGDEN